MKTRALTLGATLLAGTASLGAVTPASAQPHVDCSPSLAIPCAVVNTALAKLPGTIEGVRNIVLPVYDEVTGTVRCVIAGECP